jgi:hypothetical protein
MRCTYVSPTENPLNAKGRAHPQSPPLHLHFDQSESFLVAQGEVCTTEGYDVEERTWTPEDGVRLVEPWVPYVSPIFLFIPARAPPATTGTVSEEEKTWSSYRSALPTLRSILYSIMSLEWETRLTRSGENQALVPPE